MRLKGLRVHGFKSFADRTDFEFPPGVTCIVGPNGCGKSNVVDAVKWVLGEQRPSALRGSEMSDVIFSGTSGRKPLGLAEVTLRFDNTDHALAVDFGEVEVSRRLYRDGTSEYLLNRSKCRLRDLRELLMDTGSGPGALTFMEQGRIDRILREGVQERRAVFEEAAGISKYKARRKESLRRLQRVEADLLRISDIAEEKRRLVRSLKIQAGRAARYQELVQEMRTRRLELAVFRYGVLLERRESATTRVIALSADEESARARVAAAAEACRGAEETLETARRRASTKEAEIATLEGRAETAKEKATFAARLVSELDGRIRWYEDEIESSGERIDDLSETQTEIAEELQTAEGERDQRRGELQAVEQEMAAVRDRATAARSASGMAGERVIENVGAQSRLGNRLSHLEAREEGLSDRARRLTERAAGLGDETAAAAERATAADTERQSAVTARDESAAALTAAEERASAAETRLGDVREQVSALDREVSATRSRRDVLRNLSERMAGVDEGARKLLKEAAKPGSQLKGVRGLLATLVETDADSAVHVETALGPYASAIVVDRFEDALAAVELIERKSLGRCLLLPLDTAATAVAGAPDALLARVQCADDVRPAVAAVLAGAVVVSDLAAARERRAGDAGLGLKVLTNAGTLIDERGAILAGGAPGGAGLLQRGTELRELEERVEADQKRLASLREQLEATRGELNEARSSVGAARGAHRAADKAAERAANALERVRAEVARLERDHARIGREQAEVTELLESAREDSVRITRDLDARKAEHRDLVAQRDAAAAEYAEAEQALRVVEGRRADARVEVAAVNERCAALGARARQVVRELTEAQESVTEARRELAGCRERRTTSAERVKEAHRDQAEAERGRGEALREVVELRHALSLALERLAEQRGLISGLESEAAGVTKELQRLRIAESEARVRVESLLERVQDELELDLHAVWTERKEAGVEPEGGEVADAATDADTDAPLSPLEEEPEFDADAVQSLVDDLKRKIDRMGAVNLEALEQLESAEREANRLETQLDDLTRARTSLMETIKRIDTESRALFTTTFDTIQKNFREMFRKLFGGGKADVFLEDGADVLEAGIEIVARPPGKELRSISLLSGGERTMTAVALMFAIYQAKPSPFCLLDEVDAALDESNIDRFVGVLSGFTHQSQFIIVTHNKRTMSVADTIFGVSMPEPGVSRRLAVRLEDVLPDGELRVAS